MGTRAALRQERERTERQLRLRRALPVAGLVVALLVGLGVWRLVPQRSGDSAGSVTAAGEAPTPVPPVGATAKPKIAATPGQLHPAARPRVARAATSSSFPSGVNAGTVDRADAWAAFRGRPVDVVVTYTLRDSWEHVTHPWIGADATHFAGWPGTWVISAPLFPDSGPERGNLFSCAAGAYDAHWRAFGSWLTAQGRGSSFVRLGWEFNGNWFAWSAYDPGAWVTCFRKASAALRAADPAVRIDWNLNAHGSVGTDAFALYPGDAYVDVIGVDSYDQHPASPDAGSFSDQCYGTDGLCVAIDFARAHGKLFSVPEWGVVGQTDTAAGASGGGDNPVYVQQMYQLFQRNADILAYEAYFNDDTSGNVHSSLFGPDENPSASATYARLWGGGAGR